MAIYRVHKLIIMVAVCVCVYGQDILQQLAVSRHCSLGEALREFF